MIGGQLFQHIFS